MKKHRTKFNKRHYVEFDLFDFLLFFLLFFIGSPGDPRPLTIPTPPPREAVFDGGEEGGFLLNAPPVVAAPVMVVGLPMRCCCFSTVVGRLPVVVVVGVLGFAPIMLFLLFISPGLAPVSPSKVVDDAVPAPPPPPAIKAVAAAGVGPPGIVCCCCSCCGDAVGDRMLPPLLLLEAEPKPALFLPGDIELFAPTPNCVGLELGLLALRLALVGDVNFGSSS